MFTEKRLNQAYKEARVEYFDDDSKYIIFSDVHRGNGSHFDEFSKNQNIYKYALDYYFQNGYTYIEAGDGDELWETPRVKDIRNGHFHVFESIKRFNDAKRLIMIYGNHNIYLKNMEYVKENYYCTYSEYREMSYDFLNGIEPIESLILIHKDTGQEILVDPTIIRGIEIFQGSVQIVRWKTMMTDEGYLKVDKMVLRGPQQLEKFDMRIKRPLEY